MQFEKINDDKIRIIFNLQDLKEKNIDYHDFMANSIATQSIFLDMLSQAEKEIGFITSNYQLMIEALAASDGSFVLTVTRTREEKKRLPKKLKATPKQKLLPLDKNIPTLVYRFNSFDDFYDLCNFIVAKDLNMVSKTFNKAILYSYNDNIYLLLKTAPKADIKNVKPIISLINEFSNGVIQSSELFQNKLTEYGKIILKNNCFLKLKSKKS